MKRVFQPAKKKTVMILDDDQYFIQIFRETFQGHGFKVESARNPDQVLERLRKDRVDVLFLDLCLPGINGVELLRNIRAEFDDQSLPIIAFSNIFLGSLARAASEIGATRCLTKTDSSSDQLLSVVRELLASGSKTIGETFAEERNAGGRIRVQAELEFQEELSSAFSIHGPETLLALRVSCQAFAGAKQEESRQAELAEMHRQCRSLSGSSGPLGFRKITQMAHALEALFIEARAKPEKITPSVTRTILQGIDTLASLFDQTRSPQAEGSAPPSILVVDDESISREAVCSALRKAHLDTISLDDSFAAESLLQKEQFDLVFLDVEMPGQNGLDLCANLRKMETNRATPVVFVTAHSDFASWAKTSLSGGNDFIAKPFLPVELVVKAFSWLAKETPLRPLAGACSETEGRKLPLATVADRTMVAFPA